jgi:acetylornithine aminotransferase
VLIAARQANATYLKASHPDEPAPSDVSAALERHANVTLTTYSRPPMILTRGKGLKVYDTQEREYLDLSAGIAVNALGHADEQVARVMYEQVYLRAAFFRKLRLRQALRLVHCSNLYHNEWSGELAQILVDGTLRYGGLGHDEGSTSGEKLRVFFTSTADLP